MVRWLYLPWEGILKQSIVSDPAVLMRKPVLSGNRITVKLILENLAAGETIEQILKAHLRVTREGISFSTGFCIRGAPGFLPKKRFLTHRPGMTKVANSVPGTREVRLLVFVDESYRKNEEPNAKSTFSAVLIYEENYRDFDMRLFELKRAIWHVESSHDFELTGRHLLKPRRKFCSLGVPNDTA